jgi:hypothetical protein
MYAFCDHRLFLFCFSPLFSFIKLFTIDVFNFLNKNVVWSTHSKHSKLMFKLLMSEIVDTFQSSTFAVKHSLFNVIVDASFKFESF